MKNLALAILCLVSFSIAHAEVSHFAAPPSDVTKGFISYLEALINLREIAPADLARFADSLRRDGPIVNPVVANGSSSRLIHARELELFLGQAMLNRPLIMKWTLQKIRQDGIEKNERESASDGTRSVDQQMKFARINKGSLRIADREISIEHDFEIMTTTVTQKMWNELMLAQQVVSRTPDLPKTAVTWYDAAQFANALSKSRGLMPAYEFDGGSYSGVSDLIQDVYATEGYRLPTFEEYRFVMTGRGQHKYGQFPGVDPLTLLNYAWCAENSGGRINDVGSARPCDVDGARIYDLIGNVSVWSHDDLRISKYKPRQRTCAHLLGNAFNIQAYQAFIPVFLRHRMLEASYLTGLRLVRTLK